MQCPTCNVALVMSDRNGIEIDYCPQCRGVWLDRGELDKIIERASAGQPSPQHGQPQQFQQAPQYQQHPQQPYQQHHRDYDDDDDDHYRGHHDSHHGHHKKHKKEGFLGDLFDF